MVNPDQFTAADVETFWRQVAESESYDRERLSRDFPEETAWTLELVNTQVQWKHILSWGSADGKREPKEILDKVDEATRRFSVTCVECTDRWFNSIRKNMAPHLRSGRCEELILLDRKSAKFLEWLKHETDNNSPSWVVLGCYDLDQIIDRDHESRNWIGIRSYLSSLQEGRLFDVEFMFCLLFLRDNRMRLGGHKSVRVTRGQLLSDPVGEANRVQTEVEQMLREDEDQAIGIAVFAPTSHGVFQSTWYRKERFLSYLKLAITQNPTLDIRTGTKGFLGILRKETAPSQGVAWMLNNVLGCTYWKHQIRDLQTICHTADLS